jgi:hypothetical protein
MADYSAAAGFRHWPEVFEGLRGFDVAYLRQLKRYERRADNEFRRSCVGMVSPPSRRR